MIDTVRLRGPADIVNFKWDYTRFTGFKRKDGKEIVNEIIVRKTPHYRAFYYPSQDIIDVECNLHKILFNENVYNYSVSPAVLGGLVHSLVGTFYSSSSHVYVSRCDIGGVVTYSDRFECNKVLESYRGARMPGGRVAKWRHQNYQHSVFYRAENWSMKVYNKGEEMKDAAKEFTEFNLFNTLRFEKTYRFREMKRLGMNIKPCRGVEVSEFDVSLLLDDFFKILTDWEFSQTPHVTDKSGQMGLLSVIEQAGLFSDVESQGVVSRSTLWRYRKLKKDLQEKQIVSFSQNLPPRKLHILNYANTFGLSKLLVL